MSDEVQLLYTFVFICKLIIILDVHTHRIFKNCIYMYSDVVDAVLSLCIAFLIFVYFVKSN